MLNSQIYGVFVLLCVVSIVKSYNVIIKTSGPAVLGAQINFTAELYKNGKIAPSNTFYFQWSDNANPRNYKEFQTDKPYSNFSVIYSKSKYVPGNYEMTVNVDRDFLIHIPIAHNSTIYGVTELLNGNLVLTQNSTERNDYISIYSPLNHTISLSESDYIFLMEKATYITTYWFRNCAYVGQNNSLTYIDVYNKENEEYEIEALVVASFEKIPDPTTTTTTTTTTPATTTTSTTTPKTTSSPTTSTTSTTPAVTPSTTANPNGNTTSSTPTNGSRVKRNVANNATNVDTVAKKLAPIEKEVSPSGEEIDVKDIKRSNSTTTKSEGTTEKAPNDENSYSQPFVCMNTSLVAPDPNKTYGYFHRKVIGKIPVGNFSVTGNSWLQHGDILNLQAKCTGSLPLNYCVKIFKGPYNITGDETCVEWIPITSCQISLTHFFKETITQTVVIIVSNPVGKVVNQIAVNFYQATKQSQLSVIVVPVSFSLVAVIIVVFGAAYYIQNQSRFIIEVADFNFGETQSIDMEYKTFRARLVDSIRDVLRWSRRDLNGGTVDSTGGDDSSIKYGSMT